MIINSDPWTGLAPYDVLGCAGGGVLSIGSASEEAGSYSTRIL